MKKKSFLFSLGTGILVALFLVSCTSTKTDSTKQAEPTESSSKDSQEKGDVKSQKIQAPIEITADLSLEKGMGNIQLHFLGAAEKVRVELNGLDGLVLKDHVVLRNSALLQEENKYQKGEKSQIKVQFQAPAKRRSYLSITVLGTFGGQEYGKTVAFNLGKLDEEQRQEMREDTTTDSEGRNIKVTPMN